MLFQQTLKTKNRTTNLLNVFLLLISNNIKIETGIETLNNIDILSKIIICFDKISASAHIKIKMIKNK